MVSMTTLTKSMIIALGLGLYALTLAEDVQIKDAALRNKIATKASEISRVLGWNPGPNSKVVEKRFGEGNEFYSVKNRAGTITLSKLLRPLKCMRSVHYTPKPLNRLEKIGQLNADEVVKSRAVARRVMSVLGLGSVASFKTIEMRRSWMGMDRPVIYVECQMSVNSTLPVYRLSIPTTRMEIQPRTNTVEFLDAALPTTVDPLTKPKNLAEARATIARLLESGGDTAEVKEGAIRLMSVVWPEGKPGSPEAIRNSRLRKRLVPAYLWSGPEREIWLNANNMQVLGSWKLDKAMRAARKKSGG
jgi:hypothetical protein